jgi:hypothetical protein
MNILQRRIARWELRKAERHPVHIPAYLTAGEDADRQNCIIHDVSLAGARLTVGSKAELPDEFTLVFTRNCRVVRRMDGQIGVEFMFSEAENAQPARSADQRGDVVKPIR